MSASYSVDLDRFRQEHGEQAAVNYERFLSKPILAPIAEGLQDSGVACPHCACCETTVIESRRHRYGRRRRRVCSMCYSRFTTIEYVADVVEAKFKRLAELERILGKVQKAVGDLEDDR